MILEVAVGCGKCNPSITANPLASPDLEAYCPLKNASLHVHETSARAWCTGKTQRDRVEREVGGGIRMGNTCKSMTDSCQCMTKPTTIL